MNIKKYLPQIALALVIAVLAVTGAVQTLRLHTAWNENEKLANAFNQYRLDQQAENQREQQRRIEAMEEITREANERIAQIQMDAAVSAASADSLREQLARIRASSHTTASSGCPPAADTIGVLADVLTRADARAQRLARIADERGAAGVACEKAYEALIGK